MIEIHRPECPELATEVALLIARLQKEGKVTVLQAKFAFENMMALQSYTLVGIYGEVVPVEGDSFVMRKTPGTLTTFLAKCRGCHSVVKTDSR